MAQKAKVGECRVVVDSAMSIVEGVTIGSRRSIVIAVVGMQWSAFLDAFSYGGGRRQFTVMGLGEIIDGCDGLGRV